MLIKKKIDNKGDNFKNQDIMKLADTSEAKIDRLESTTNCCTIFLLLEPCVLQMLDDAAWVFPNLSIEFNENMVEYEYILAC